MTCEDVIRGEIVEKYVLDELSDDLKEPFEEHYFECGRCFSLLQTYRAVQAELVRTRADAQVEAPRRGWWWQWAWAPALAVGLIALGVWFWQQSQRNAANSPSMATAPPAVPAVVAPEPPPPSVDLLARFEPPQYLPGRLRGTADPATQRFQEGMKRYQQGDYAAAAAALSAAAKLDPDAPHIGFFLGVSHLLAGDARAAIDALAKTTSLGDSPYLEDAYFYLAKAHLSQRNIDPAAAALRSAVALKGERAAEVRQLLDQVESLARPPS